MNKARWRRGIYGGGTLFRLTAAGALDVLRDFGRETNNGGMGSVGSLLQASDGNFYGTASAGGAYRDGAVFEVNPNGVVSTLHSFDYSDGDSPTGLIQGSDGSFYGTTAYGGANGNGTIFKVTPTGSRRASSSATR